MKASLKITTIILLLCNIQSCSDNDFPKTYHYNKVIELPANYIDSNIIPDIRSLNIAQVTIINSEEYLSDFFRNLNLIIPSQLLEIDFKDYSFLFVANITRYCDVIVKNEIKKIVVDNNKQTNYIYNITEYYKEINIVKEPSVCLIYYTGIVVDKIENDNNIAFIQNSSNIY